MAKTDPINVNNPAGSSDRKLGDDYIRALARAVIEILNKEHYVGSATSGAYNEDAAGEHKQVVFNAPLAADPVTVEASKGELYTKDVSAKAELHWIDEDENVIEMTRVGKIDLDKNILSNNTPIVANKASSGTANLIKLNASDVPEILVGAVLSASTAPAADASISPKKYVDDSIAALGFVPTIATQVDGNTVSVTLPNGLILKWGTVTLTNDSNTDATFATPFPTGCLSAQLTVEYVNGNDFAFLVSKSASKLVIRGANISTATVHYFAIGY